MAKHKWIGRAIRKPGALRSRLEGLGVVKRGRKIPAGVLDKAASGVWGVKTAQRARFVKLLRGFR